MKILLGTTGSVAATLTPKLVEMLIDAGHEVKVVATDKALYFFHPKQIPIEVITESHEWPGSRYLKNDEVLHIELAKWADVLLVAPCTANTLAKLALGMVDNLLTSVARAMDLEKPLIIAPAMNTKMWQHPATNTHLETIGKWYPNFTVVLPIEKKLACGDTGVGALADLETIVRTSSLKQFLKS
ncbi:MAG: hypothetical protein UT32_C0047G0002 [Parcubacteria group bacterium GW2011_GWC2_39_14]|nr:MAG: hypothetical protein UT32_C0047G0002 [Parcubacteria group bacterium GW2011_GWC2_39_14]